MTPKPLLLVLALAATSIPAAAQSSSSSSQSGETRAVLAAALPRVDSVASAALAAVRPMSDGLRRSYDDRRWVRTAKWSLLAAAAGFGAYALANSRADRTDSRAQLGIVGGQLALLGSVGLFIYDLRPHDHTPENIPFEQSADSNADPGRGARAPR